MTNEKLAAQFFELHNLVMDHQESSSDPYRASTYAKVGKYILALNTSISEIPDSTILSQPGIGTSSLEKIRMALKNGIIPKLQEYRLKYGNIDHLEPVYAVLELNFAKNVKTSRNGRIVISAKIKNRKRFLKMLSGITIPNSNKEGFICGGIELFLQIN